LSNEIIKNQLIHETMRDRAENLLKDLIKRMFAGNYMEPDKSYPTEVTWAGCRRLEDGSMEIEVAVDSVRHVPPHPVKFTVKKIEEQIRNLVTMGIILEHEVEAVTKKFKDQLTDSVKKMGTKNDKDHIGKFLLEDYPGYDPGKEINRIIIGPLGASDQPPNMVAPNTTQAGDPSHPSSHSSPDPTLEKPPPKPEHEVNQSEKLEKEVEEIKIKSSTAPPVATSEPVVTKAIGRFNMKPVVEDKATKNTIQKDENTQTNEQTIDKVKKGVTYQRGHMFINHVTTIPMGLVVPQGILATYTKLIFRFLAMAKWQIQKILKRIILSHRIKFWKNRPIRQQNQN